MRLRCASLPGDPDGSEIRAPQLSDRPLVRAFPTAPTFKPVHSHRSAGMVTVEVDVDYGDGVPWKGVFVYRLEAGLIAHERAYFAAPFKPADWRKPFLDGGSTA